EEENGCVVTHQIPVALFGVELHGDASNVSFGIGSAALACNGGESCKHGGLLADFRKNLCPSVLSDVVRHGERAVCPCTFGVHATLRYHFAIKVCQFLDEPNILKE